MKNVSHIKNWNRGAVQLHVDTTPTTLIKTNKDKKLDKDCVKKFHRDLTSEKPDIYELKTALFDNGKPEKFLLFVRNFQMTIEVSGKIASGSKIQYICTLVRGKYLRQLETLSVKLESTTTENLTLIILGLGT